MDKRTTILFLIWAVLAVAAFVAGFYAPMWIKIIEVVFGIINIAILLAWGSAAIQAVREHRKLNNNKEE